MHVSNVDAYMKTKFQIKLNPPFTVSVRVGREDQTPPDLTPYTLAKKVASMAKFKVAF